MLRSIQFTVNENGVKPSIPQFAGVQGENGATRIVFSFGTAVAAALTQAFNANKSVNYRVDFERSDGSIISSVPAVITTTANINFDLMSNHTLYGGSGVLTLVIGIYSSQTEEYETYISVPARLYFKDFPGININDSADISLLYLETKELRDNTYTLVQTAQSTQTAINSKATEFYSAAAEAEETLQDICDETEGYAQNAQNYSTAAESSKQSAASSASAASSDATSCNQTKSYVNEKYASVVNYATSASQSATAAAGSEQRIDNTVAQITARLGTEIATLVNGKIPVSQIPEIALTGVHTVASQAAMEALTVQDGDICIRTDLNKTYVYANGWTELLVPTDTCAYAGYADTAGVAQNALKINNKSIAYLTPAEYASIVPDANTYYFVG